MDPDSAPTGHSLAFGGADSVSGIHAEKGEKVVFGNALVTNVSQATVVIQSFVPVSLSGPAPTVLQRFVRSPTNGELIGADGWPSDHLPAADLETARGYAIRSGEAVELILVVKVTQDKRTTWENLEVSYTSGRESFTQTGTVGIEICPISDDSCT